MRAVFMYDSGAGVFLTPKRLHLPEAKPDQYVRITKVKLVISTSYLFVIAPAQDLYSLTLSATDSGTAVDEKPFLTKLSILPRAMSYNGAINIILLDPSAVEDVDFVVNSGSLFYIISAIAGLDTSSCRIEIDYEPLNLSEIDRAVLDWSRSG